MPAETMAGNPYSAPRKANRSRKRTERTQMRGLICADFPCADFNEGVRKQAQAQSGGDAEGERRGHQRDKCGERLR